MESATPDFLRKSLPLKAFALKNINRFGFTETCYLYYFLVAWSILFYLIAMAFFQRNGWKVMLWL